MLAIRTYLCNSCVPLGPDARPGSAKQEKFTHVENPWNHELRWNFRAKSYVSATYGQNIHFKELSESSQQSQPEPSCGQNAPVLFIEGTAKAVTKNREGEKTKVTTIPIVVRAIGEARRLSFTSQKTHTSRICPVPRVAYRASKDIPYTVARAKRAREVMAGCLGTPCKECHGTEQTAGDKGGDPHSFSIEKGKGGPRPA